MGKGKFFNLIFVLIGSALLIALGGIVTANFMKDARIFQQTVATAVQDPEVKPPEKKEDKKTAANAGVKKPESGTNKQKTAVTTKEAEKDKPEETQKTGQPNPEASKEKIKVEVVNYSGIKRVAEQIKSTLEASGYEVSAGNGKTNKTVKTQILERNDKKAGTEIQKLLKIGPVAKSPDPNSRFDVSIIIGDDYKP